MPFPIAAVAAPLAGLVGQGINAITQGSTNRSNQQHAEHLYRIQRDDARKQWEDTNNYNSPQEQMKRLQAAGLNPNLVYGNGSAVNTTSPAQTPTPHFEAKDAPRFDLATPVQGYFDMQIKQAQLDNLKAQNTMIAEQTAGVGLENKARAFDLGFKTDTRDSNIDIIGSRAIKDRNEAQIIQDNARVVRELANSDTDPMSKDMRVQEAVQKIVSQKLSNEAASKAIKKLEGDIQFQQLDMNLRKMGISSSDPMWARMIAQLLAKLNIKLF